MQVPFTSEEFFRVFHDYHDYNVAAWPIQIVLIVTALFLGVYPDLAFLPAAAFGIWLAVNNKRAKRGAK